MSYSDEFEKCPFCGDTPKDNVFFTRCGADGLEMVAEIACPCGIRRSVKLNGNNVPFQAYLNAFCEVTEKWNQRVNTELKG